jgi:nitroreductase
MNPEDINDLIRNRRSVFPKDYTGEKIDDNIISQLLENANWAPTHKLTEPWRFKVFCEGGLRTFAEKQAKHYYDKNFGTDKFLDKKYQKLLTNPLKCSHLISIGMYLNADRPIPEVEEISAVACAVQNILLSAHVYGLGGYWSTGGLTYVDEAKPFFNLGEEDKLMGFIYLGVMNKAPGPGQRHPLDKKVIWFRD